MKSTYLIALLYSLLFARVSGRFEVFPASQHITALKQESRPRSCSELGPPVCSPADLEFVYNCVYSWSDDL